MEKVSELHMVSGLEAGGPSPSGPSEIERLVEAFELHQRGEEEVTRRYQAMAHKSKSPLVRFLLQLMVSDEEKHHALTHSMISTLRAGLDWSRPEDAIGGLGEIEGERDELLALTENFLRLERDGIKECKRLMKSSRDYYGGLFEMLLRLMVRDSEKHVEIMDFLRARLKGAM